MAIFPFFREISFAAFLISGILGSVNYYKSGNLDLKTAGVLSAGSFVGALGRCQDQPSDSGGHDENNSISRCSALRNFLLCSERQAGNTEEKSRPERPFFLVLGAVTGAVCAASGAGGPGACNADSDTARYSGAHRSRYFPV